MQEITRPRKQLSMIVEDGDHQLTPFGREVMRELYEEFVALDERISRADHMVQRVFRESAPAQVEGIGPVVATALVAAVGKAIPRSLPMDGVWQRGWVSTAAVLEWRQGATTRYEQARRSVCTDSLDTWARATVHRARRQTDARNRWIMGLEQRRGNTIATVAIANKNARLAWALLTSEAEYHKAV